MGRAVWRVTEKPKIAIFGPGPGPVRPHGEAGLDGLGGRGPGEDPSMDGTALPQRQLLVVLASVFKGSETDVPEG